MLSQEDYDLSRFRFTGFLPERELADVLALSDLHIYLTAPFVTSWSMLDAMGCGCVVLASDQACTREYIEHGRNGLLCDFFDAEGIARSSKWSRGWRDSSPGGPRERVTRGDAGTARRGNKRGGRRCLPDRRALPAKQRSGRDGWRGPPPYQSTARVPTEAAR